MLAQAIQSVVNQTYPNIEIIVVDDGSVDKTEKVMQQFKEKYSFVKYLKHDEPKGANAARNYAIKEAKGYFITGLDDDDEMLPNHIIELVEAYDKRYAYVFAAFNVFEDNKVYIRRCKFDHITLNDMLYKNWTGNQVLTTRKMFFDAGLFDESLPASQDYDMWLRMLKLKPLAKFLNEPTYNHYATSHNRITTSKKRKKGCFQCYKKHKEMMSIAQRQQNLRYLRHIDGKKNSSFKMIHTLNSIQKWPRLYLGLIIRRVIKVIN